MVQQQRFTPEFKREAVRQMRESDKSGAAVARELGIPRSRLYKWAAEADRLGAAAFSGSGRKPDDELAKLKRAYERLQEENEILKKAAAYFARELP